MNKKPNKNVAVSLIPTALTVLAICFGLTSIKFALEGRFGIAITLITTAAILDALDGRTARFLNATSDMGVQVDSLADATNFGVAPAIVLYLAFQDQKLNWMIILIFAVSIILRLARFNAIAEKQTMLEYEKDFFVGVPAPAGALLALLPLGLKIKFGEGWWTNEYAITIWLIFVAFLIVSRIPTYSFKTINTPPNKVPFVLVLVCALAGLSLTEPLILFFILDFLYLLHIPWAWKNQKWIIKRPETWHYKTEARNEIRKKSKKNKSNLNNQAISKLWISPRNKDNYF